MAIPISPEMFDRDNDNDGWRPKPSYIKSTLCLALCEVGLTTSLVADQLSTPARVACGIGGIVFGVGTGVYSKDLAFHNHRSNNEVDTSLPEVPPGDEPKPTLDSE